MSSCYWGVASVIASIRHSTKDTGVGYTVRRQDVSDEVKSRALARGDLVEGHTVVMEHHYVGSTYGNEELFPDEVKS